MADINKIVNIKVESDIDKTTKDTKKLDKSLDSVSKTSKKTSKGIGAISKISNVASKGIKGIGTAISALGLGAILAPIGALTAIFAKNQKVIDAVTTTLNVAQLAVNAVTDAIGSAYDIVKESTDGFDALKKVISSLLTVAITPLKLSFYAIKGAIQEANLAYQKIFGDDSSVIEAQTALIETRKALSDVSKEAVQAGKDVIDNFGEAISEISEGATVLVDELGKIEPKKIYESAKAMTELNNNALLASASQAGLVEEMNREAEKLRQFRDDERNTIESRIEANNKLKKTLEEQSQAMIKQAELQIASAQANVDANDSIENQVALIEALNNKKAILAQVEGFNSEQKANDLALDKEIIELTNSQIEADNTLAIQKKRFLAEQITDDEMRIEALRSVLELEKEIELERLEFKRDSYNEGTQAYVDAQNELNAKKQEFFEADVSLDNELKTVRKTNADADLAQDEARRQSKIDTLDTISDIAGRETKLGKALLVAKALLQAKEMIMEAKGTLFTAKQSLTKATVKGAEASVDVAKGASATASVGFPQNIPLLIGFAAQAVGIISAVKSATSKVKQASAGAGASGGGFSSGSIPLPSAFDSVSQTESQNDSLASSITNQQSEQPIQAYVTSTDVSSANALERNRIEDAGF